VKVYERDFATLYDFLVYNCEEAKASEIELGFINWVFDNACPRKVRRILDIGCGNGRFLIPLARKGYEAFGLDNSGDMLEECDRRLHKYNLRADLIKEDLEELNFNKEFDALICMDSVICYLLDTTRIIKALPRFRRALHPKGLLILENWNFFHQWELLEKTLSGVRGNDRIRIEYQNRYRYESFTSILHIETMANVQEGKGSYKLYHEEILRLMTVGEMEMYLREAGFAQVSIYPSFNRSEADNSSGEHMIFLAVRS